MAIKMNPKGFLALQCLVTHVTHELMIQITFKTKSVLAFELVNRPRYVCSWCDGQERELELRNKREREYITHSDAAASQNNTRLKYEELRWSPVHQNWAFQINPSINVRTMLLVPFCLCGQVQEQDFLKTKEHGV